MKTVKRYFRRLLKQKSDNKYGWVKSYFIGSVVGLFATLFFGLFFSSFFSSMIGYMVGWSITWFLIRTGELKPVLVLAVFILFLCSTRVPDLLAEVDSYRLQLYPHDREQNSRFGILSFRHLESTILHRDPPGKINNLMVKRGRDFSFAAGWRHALAAKNSTVQQVSFPTWAKCVGDLKKQWHKFKDMDLWTCAARSICWDAELHISFESANIKVDRVWGLHDILGSKRGLCSNLQSVFNSGETKGSSLLREMTLDCWVLTGKEQLNVLPSNASRWIVKSDGGAGGITQNAEIMRQQVERNHKAKWFVVQKMSRPPMVVGGKSFLIKVQVLLTSSVPVRLYVHDTFALVQHGEKSRPDPVAAFTQLRLDLGTASTEKLIQSVEESIAMLFVSMEGQFRSSYNKIKPGFECNACFQLFGVDVVVDEAGKAFVVEVQPAPNTKHFGSFETAQTDVLSMIFDKLDLENRNFGLDLRNELERVKTEDLSKSDYFPVLHLGLDEFFSWVHDDHITYMYKLFRETRNLNHFRAVYPSLQRGLSLDAKQRWQKLFAHLEVPPARRKFHSLLHDTRRLFVKVR